MSKSEGQVLDFEKICRLCLLEKRSMSSIFAKKKSDKKVPLPVRIMSCASLELYEGDGLPASICSKCLLSVNQSYAFREQCEQADTTLRQYAQRINEASGETSSNREHRELIANDSLEHIGINIEENYKNEDEDFKRRDYLDMNYGNIKISKNLQINEVEISFKKKDPLIAYLAKEKSIDDVKLNFSNTSKGCGQRLKPRENLSINGKSKKQTKSSDDSESKMSNSFDSPLLKGLTTRKLDNVAVIADVSHVLKDKNCDFGVTETENDNLLFQNIKKKWFRHRFTSKKDHLPAANGDYENNKQLELLQNLMKNKSIIIKKRCSSIPADFFNGKILALKYPQLNKIFWGKKGLMFPDNFELAQLWKKWKEVIKRVPEVTKGKMVSVPNENHQKEKNDQNAKANWKSAKDTVYCGDCRIFLLKTSYYNHIKFVHKKIRKYLCQTCGYAACTGTVLRQHVQAVHVGYSFSCDQCPKKFNLMKRLRKHLELHHSGKPIEKNHICQYCAMAFLKAEGLKRHLRSHTQETPYQCQYCQRRFKYRWPKVQHERLHTGEKPYKCSFCNERFTQNCVRKAHEYKRHGDDEFRPETHFEEKEAFSLEKEESESYNSGLESS